jgi:hypothetical protein
VAAWVLAMFLNFYLPKKHNIADNRTTTEATEKISIDLEFFEFQKILTKFEKIKFYLMITNKKFLDSPMLVDMA